MTIYTFPSYEEPAVIKAIESANKKLAKAGVDGFRYTISKTHLNTIYGMQEGIKVNVKEPLIDAAGYIPVAFIDHKNNVITRLSSHDDDDVTNLVEGYRHNRGCDHCGKNIFRNYTMVIRKDNDFKHIGNTCLEPFCGSTSIVNVLDTVRKTIGFLSEEREITSYYAPMHPTDIMSWACQQIISSKGYVSKSMAEDIGGTSTAEEMEDFANGGYKFNFNIDESTAVDTSEIKKFIDEGGMDWASLDFKNNVKAAFSDDWVTSKQFSFMAAAVQFYRQAQLRAKLSSTEKYKIGEKREENVKVLKKQVVDSYYGFTNRYDLLTNENVLLQVYTTSSKFQPELNEEIKIGFIVKNVNDKSVIIKNPKIV